MTVRTRFAPSPTGYLHIGGARTALFAWAWARQQQGEFILRIEDTDVMRSSTKHSDAIIRAFQWLQLDIDGEPRFQSTKRKRHVALAEQLLANGYAYRCYCTPQELEQMRAGQIARGESTHYDRRWRNSEVSPPPGIRPVIRFKMPLAGQSCFTDKVKGEMCIDTVELDDFVLLRADGLPTYNWANVIDDIDEGVTHVIRGDDHVMNTFRQQHVYAALGKVPPVFAHLPMILSAIKDESGNIIVDDGIPRYERMSKRNAAVDVMQYQTEGFLPEALINYLARLSWSYGDVEIFNRDFLVQHFNFAAVQRSPARFDREKLCWINREHFRAQSPASLQTGELATVDEAVIALALSRTETFAELREEISYFILRPQVTAELLTAHCDNHALLKDLHSRLVRLSKWDAENIKQVIKQTAKDNMVKFAQLGMPLRVLLTGRISSPDIAVVAALLGQDEAMSRLEALFR